MSRRSNSSVPPRVEYLMTDLGQPLMPILKRITVRNMVILVNKAFMNTLLDM
ncbi:winged helix-turn-helix transcriptional regulator [Fictibacillus barbaricus]|uniref:Winged helix-turn-helix transcriptional regulator n=1 Tax=Fictibacillus barbaricus TaxID=182136 RepID=A0ABS2ZB74_9BACL|nr:winged helix-turn-helix transcriptional regulator [Fictibacillus barbaricus]